MSLSSSKAAPANARIKREVSARPRASKYVSLMEEGILDLKTIKKPFIEFIEEDLCVTAAMKYIDSLHSTVCVLTPNSDSAENSLSFEAICGGNAIIIS